MPSICGSLVPLLVELDDGAKVVKLDPFGLVVDVLFTFVAMGGLEPFLTGILFPFFFNLPESDGFEELDTGFRPFVGLPGPPVMGAIVVVDVELDFTGPIVVVVD